MKNWILSTSIPRLAWPTISPQPGSARQTRGIPSLRADEFWRLIPGFANVTAAEFHTHTFQSRHTATNIRQIKDLLQDRASDSFFEDVASGVERAPMALRISPYLLGLIDWNDPYHDPIRTQFLPLASQQLPNHPELRLDSLASSGTRRCRA